MPLPAVYPRMLAAFSFSRTTTTHTLSTHRQTQINPPHNPDRAPKQHPLINRHPQKADQANRRPELVSIHHHRPELVPAIRLHHIPSIHTGLALRVDVAHVGEEHERVYYRADGLVEKEFDKDVCFAERRLGGVGLLLGRDRGGGGNVGWEVVFEVGLPEDVGRGAEDAEEGEFEDLGVV
jgi:hypothetical protein